MRSFIAIDMPEPARDALVALQTRLRAGRPVPCDNFHLTLAFLGDQPDGVLDELNLALEVMHVPRFELALSGVGAFGGESPKVAFAGVAPSSRLEEAHRAVTRAVRKAGIVLPRERFRPHVTLARFGHAPGPDTLGALRDFLADAADFTFDPVPVQALTLYGSTLRPDGAIHEPLAQYLLA